MSHKTTAGKKNRRKRRSKAGPHKKAPVKDENTAQLFSTMIQSTLILQQQMRMVLGILLEVYLIPATSKVATTMVTEQRAFAAEAAKRRGDRDGAQGENAQPRRIFPRPRDSSYGNFRR